METIERKLNNKEAIYNLYENILNKRNLELLNDLVSEQYANDKGDKGLDGFRRGITEALKAFPDAQWEIVELVSEENRIMVKQIVRATHTGDFQGILATGKKINSEGFAIYNFVDGKIIYHQIQTDRLSFLQQAGVLPLDLSILNK